MLIIFTLFGEIASIIFIEIFTKSFFDALGSPGRFRHVKYIYIKTFYNRLFAFKAFTKV